MICPLYLNSSKYIPVSLASKLTGYTSDYIGQLCRGERVKCCLVGARWFVEEKSIVQYQPNTNVNTDYQVYISSLNSEFLNHSKAPRCFLNENSPISNVNKETKKIKRVSTSLNYLSYVSIFTVAFLSLPFFIFYATSSDTALKNYFINLKLSTAIATVFSVSDNIENKISPSNIKSVPQIIGDKLIFSFDWTSNNFFDTVDRYKILLVPVNNLISSGLVAISELDKKASSKNSRNNRESDLAAQALQAKHRDEVVQVFSSFGSFLQTSSVNFSQKVDFVADQIRSENYARKMIYNLSSFQKYNSIALKEVKEGLNNSLAYLKQIILPGEINTRMTASVVPANNTTVLDPASKGLEIMDDVTGDIYCVKIRNGDLAKDKGNCEVSSDLPVTTDSNSVTSTSDVQEVPEEVQNNSEFDESNTATE